MMNELTNHQWTTIQESLEKIIKLAQTNKDEDWDDIDKEIAKYANEKKFYERAEKNLQYEYSGVRDLAASILEESNIKITSIVIDNLFTLLNEKHPENKYPAFRAACALARRITNPKILERTEEIKTKLREFLEDEVVAKIADEYLNKIEENTELN